MPIAITSAGNINPCEIIETEKELKKSNMPANSSVFAETKLPHQKNYGGIVFPAVLSPAAVDSGDRSVLTAAVKEEKPWLDALLHKHGAVLFRGFDALTTASDFNDIVESFGYEELPYVGGAAPRTNVVGRVFTANESPPDQKIPFHHEMAQVSLTCFLVCVIALYFDVVSL